MKPWYQPTGKVHGFVWEQNHEEIRKKIIDVLTSDPVMTILNASADGYGAILLHRIDGKCRVIEYFSKCTSASESKYNSYELETLAVYNAVKHFRQNLHGRKFFIHSDCNSLKESRTKAELTPRVHRCWGFLQAFDFSVEYRKGTQMAHVGCLSYSRGLENNKQSS